MDENSGRGPGDFLKPSIDALRSAFEDFGDCPHLILDFRGNGGGTDAYARSLAGMLLAADSSYYWLATKFSDELRVYQGTPAQTESEGWTTPFVSGVDSGSDSPSYRGSLWVLIDERCFSATDNLLACLDDLHPDVTFIGRPTNGGTGAPRKLLSLKYSKAQISFCTMLLKSPIGRLIEGVGTQPDVPVEWTQQAVVDHADPDLQAALELIRKAR